MKPQQLRALLRREPQIALGEPRKAPAGLQPGDPHVNRTPRGDRDGHQLGVGVQQQAHDLQRLSGAVELLGVIDDDHQALRQQRVELAQQTARKRNRIYAFTTGGKPFAQQLRCTRKRLVDRGAERAQQPDGLTLSRRREDPRRPCTARGDRLLQRNRLAESGGRHDQY